MRHNRGSLCCVHMGGCDAPTQLLHEPSCKRRRRVQPRVLEVDVLRVRSEGAGKCLRQHPKNAHPAHQVAMLKRAGVICNEVVDVQAASDATPD